MQRNTSDDHALALFLAIAFGWAWFFWVPVALEDIGVIIMPDWFAAIVAGGQPAAWGPLIGAIVVALLRNGFTGLRDLGARMVRVRFSPKFYLVAIGLLPVIVGLAQLAATLLGEDIPPSVAFDQPVGIPIAFVYIFFLAGPLQEEAGWRGTATPLSESRIGAPLASLITGVIWGLWHLPLFFQNRDEIYYNQPFWGLLISTTLLSVLHTWIYKRTGNSLFAAMLMHTSWNWSNYVFMGLLTDTGGLVFLILLVGTALLAMMQLRSDTKV